jgi:hypothetical protein
VVLVPQAVPTVRQALRTLSVTYFKAAPLEQCLCDVYRYSSDGVYHFRRCVRRDVAARLLGP